MAAESLSPGGVKGVGIDPFVFLVIKAAGFSLGEKL